jgi:hypothetical protein
MTVVIAQTHTLDADQVKAMIADHYQANNVPVVAGNIHHRVHEGSSGGFSGSGPSLGDTVIYFHGQKRAVGMPDSITLRPLQIQEIAAEFFTEALGFKVSPGSVDISVSGSSGGGFSSSSARLNSLSVRSKRTIG